MIKKGLLIGGLIASMMVFGGCGTIMNGSGTSITITSVPNADLLIDGKKYGKTPVSVKLSNKKSHSILLESDGYQPYKALIKQNASGGSILGNLLLGGVVLGIPFILIDTATGGIHYLTPVKINTQLAKIGIQKLNSQLVNVGIK